MSGIRHPLMINGMPVMTVPEEIDVTTAEQLRAVLLYSAVRGHATAVVDMSRTWFCDSAGLTVRIFAITRLDLVIPLFTSLDEALAPRPAAVIRPFAAAAIRRAAPFPADRPPGQDGMSRKCGKSWRPWSRHGHPAR